MIFNKFQTRSISYNLRSQKDFLRSNASTNQYDLIPWDVLRKVWQMIPLEIKNSVSFWDIIHYRVHIAGNKAKGRISKRVFQGIKARQFFRKTNISYPLTGTHMYLLSPWRTCLRFWLSVLYLSKSLVACLQLTYRLFFILRNTWRDLAIMMVWNTVII